MQRRQLLLGALALDLLPALAWAQDYPKPGATLRYIVPFAPGGLTDVMARSVAQAMTLDWKATVVVDNRPGGGGQIGADDAAKSAPDGNTLLAITLTHAANYTLFPKAPYNFVRDLKPVALMASSAMLVVVPASSPIASFKDLLGAARDRHLNAGSSGNGTPPHLTLALFNQLAQTSVQHVPYKGGAPSITDLMGGQLDVIFSNFPESIAQVRAGKLRALAICSNARDPSLPQVPTTAEVGMPGLLVDNWTAMMVPAGVSDAIVDKLGAEVLKIMADPEIVKRATTQGFRVDARGPQAFAVFLKSEVARWNKVITEAKITVE